MPKKVNFASFSRPEVRGHTVLPEIFIQTKIGGKCQNISFFWHNQEVPFLARIFKFSNENSDIFGDFLVL